MVGNLAVSLLLAVTTSAAALSATPQTAPFPNQGEPITDVAYTADLEAHHSNGKLPAESLFELASSPGCLVEKEAAEAWLRLEAQAIADGIEFEAGWCYRSLRVQRRTYRRNCPLITIMVDPPDEPAATPTEPGDETQAPDLTEPQDPAAPGEQDDPTEPVDPPEAPDETDPGDPIDPVDSPDEGSEPDDEVAVPEPRPVKRIRICRVPTARPGNSNHGWGRAIDITQDGVLLTCESPTFLWLLDNASSYGWVHPGWAACGEPKEEAWHWEWGATVYQAKTLEEVGLVAE